MKKPMRQDHPRDAVELIETGDGWIVEDLPPAQPVARRQRDELPAGTFHGRRP